MIDNIRESSIGATIKILKVIFNPRMKLEEYPKYIMDD